MKIGIIGSGIVGRVLATAFLQEGHDVMLGTRSITKDEVLKWKDENPTGDVGDFNITAKFGEILVLATGGLVTIPAIELAGIENFAGKVVIDATNPIDTTKPPVNGVLQFFTAQNSSLLQQIQAFLPGAKLVKSFNSVGNPVMYKPQLSPVPTMFICGNDDAAKQTVTEILTAFGWETADMGKAEAAGAIESLCILWCIPGFTQNLWSHAFKLVK